jgi:carboxyl-terminal processing protease
MVLKKFLIGLPILTFLAFPPHGRGLAGGADAYTTLSLLQKYHVYGISIDEKVINDVKIAFIKYLDPAGIYFIKSDYEELRSVPLGTKEFSTTVRSTFFLRTEQRFKMRLDETIKSVSAICARKIDFPAGETLSLEKQTETPRYPEHIQAKTALWKKLIQLEILSLAYRRYDNEKNDSTFRQYLDANEQTLRTDAGKRIQRRIDYILKIPEGYDNLMQLVYLNCISTRFDNHSEVMSSKFMKRLISDLSSESESFGFTLGHNSQGEITIGKIIPGGPAWKNGGMNSGDSILSIQIPDLPAVELDNSMLDDAYDLLNGKSDTIIVRIRKKNRLTVSIKLIREKISGENRILTSYVLEGRKKIGYIYLPAFYTDWDFTGKLGCANDVAKEIFKLQKSRIDGLILDLRDNGGGSIGEALDLAGLFIDEGPMGIIVNGKNPPAIFKDPSRGTCYDGPLVVMVNGNSASASELVASILKDYNRALIVGSTTFGKGTAQEIIPDLKEFIKDPVRKFTTIGKNDYLKITTSVMYNIAGISYQKTGITPHITYPDLAVHGAMREENLNSPLIPKPVTKQVRIEKLPDIGISPIAEKSRTRVAKSDRFAHIIRFNSMIAGYRHSSTISLDPDAFFSESKNRLTLEDGLINVIFIKSESYSVKMNLQDADLAVADAALRDICVERIKQINEDPFVDETYRITIDYLASLKK